MKGFFDSVSVFHKPVIDGVLDPLWIADLQRRGAYSPSHAVVVNEISRTMFGMARAMVEFDSPESFTHPDHKRHKETITQQLQALSERAEMAGADRILFPVRAGSAMAGLIAGIIAERRIAGNFTFREESYSTDLSAAGRIRPEIKSNILNYNAGAGAVRGLWDIDCMLMRKWDAEVLVGAGAPPALKAANPQGSPSQGTRNLAL